MRNFVVKYVHSSQRYKGVNNNIMLLATFLGGISANIIVMSWDNNALLYYIILFLVVTASFAFFSAVITAIYSNIHLDRFLSGAATANDVDKISMILQSFFAKGVSYKNLSLLLCNLGIISFLLFIYLRLCEINILIAALCFFVFLICFLSGKRYLTKSEKKIASHSFENLIEFIDSKTPNTEPNVKETHPSATSDSLTSSPPKQTQNQQVEKTHTRESIARAFAEDSNNNKTVSNTSPEVNQVKKTHTRESIARAFVEDNHDNKTVSNISPVNQVEKTHTRESIARAFAEGSSSKPPTTSKPPEVISHAPKINNRWLLQGSSSFYDERLYMTAFHGLDVMDNKEVTMVFFDKNINYQKLKPQLEKLAQIQHPALAKIHDVFMGEYQQRESLFVVVDGIAQKVLGNLVDEKMKENQANNIILQISKALYFLEQHNLYHWCLEPKFIHVDHEMKIKIWWAGMPKIEKEWDTTATVPDKKSLASVHYMPIEVIMKAKATSLYSSIYGLGMIWYKLLTGTTPFDGQDLPQILSSKYRSHFSPHDVCTDISPETNQMITSMIQKDIDKRPQSFKKIIDFLSQ